MQRTAIAPALLDLIESGSAGDIDFYSQYARHSGGPVLVVMCGTGRVANAIARQGVPVIGIDTDPAMIDLAKRKAQQAGVARAMFVKADPTHFVTDSKHPLVMIPSGALQRLTTLDEQRLCLTAVRDALGLSGRLLLDMPLLDHSLADEGRPQIRPGTGGEGPLSVRRYRKWDSARQLTEELLQVDHLGDDGRVTDSYMLTNTLRYATPGELVLLLEACGFRAAAFGGFEREPLMPGSTRVVVEAERK